MCGYSDTECAVDKETRKNITGYIVILNIVVIEYLLKSQETVTLSVKEDKYTAVTEICCEILFIRVVLLFIGVVIEYPITMHVDNIGYIIIRYHIGIPMDE